MKILKVKASGEYDILIGEGILDGIADAATSVIRGGKAAVVTDSNVAPIYLERVLDSLKRKGVESFSHVIEAGESSKDLKHLGALLNAFAEDGLTRADVVIALGGGVTGDLAGFAASCYLRGVRYIQIPTTLLAMVDSSVGGKTAIDLDYGKNLAGAFYQPSLVLCDHSTLSTLPDEVFTDGCAEVIKYGIIADAELFDRLKDPIKPQIEDVIYDCVRIKRDVVEEDEKDTGLRQILNFGHTIGHAVEKLSSYTISHGKAVAIGSAMISRAAAKRGICTPEYAEEITELLSSYGLPTFTSYDPGMLFRAAVADKKRTGEYINLILPVEKGRCIIKRTPFSELEAMIREGME